MINIPMNTRPPVSLSDMANAQSSGNPAPTPGAGTAPMGASMNQTPYGTQQQNQNSFGTPNQNPASFATPNQTQTSSGSPNPAPGSFATPNQNTNSYQTQTQNPYGSPSTPQTPVGSQPTQPSASYNSQANFNTQSPTNSMPHPAATGVILKKGQKTSLAKFGGALENIDVGLGWDVANQGIYDLDAECFILGDNEKVIGDDWFVYYNQPASPDGSVRHSGDNRNGAGSGDDEVIHIRLSQVAPQVKKLVFVVTINEAKERNLNFSGVQNAYIRLVDQAANRELCRFNLTEYYSNVTSMVVAELYRHNGEWKMNPVGDGVQADLFDLCMRYGVNVAG